MTTFALCALGLAASITASVLSGILGANIVRSYNIGTGSPGISEEGGTLIASIAILMTLASGIMLFLAGTTIDVQARPPKPSVQIDDLSSIQLDISEQLVRQETVSFTWDHALAIRNKVYLPLKMHAAPHDPAAAKIITQLFGQFEQRYNTKILDFQWDGKRRSYVEGIWITRSHLPKDFGPVLDQTRELEAALYDLDDPKKASEND